MDEFLIDNKLKIIDIKDLDALIAEALNKGDVLATRQESQMLINMTGVSITSKPRKDGRYQGYILQDGDKKYVYGSTREEVATKIKVYLKEGIPKRKKRKKSNVPTLSEWMDKWIELYKKPNLKPSSLTVILAATVNVREVFSKKPIDEITTDEIQSFLLSMKAERLRDICRDALRQSLEKAKLQGIIKNNPCDALEIKKHKYGKKQALTIEEQALFLNAAKESPYDLLYRFMLSTGVRIGEALALRKSDFDFKNRTVEINKDVVFINGKRTEQNTPKTEAGNRIIPVREDILAEIIKLDTKNELIFPYTYNAVRLATTRIAKAINIKVSLHILRHTYATRLEEAGISPKIIQYLMGHASLDMTKNIYTDVQKDYIYSVSKKITSAFDTK